jgi:hypothetical protein
MSRKPNRVFMRNCREVEEFLYKLAEDQERESPGGNHLARWLTKAVVGEKTPMAARSSDHGYIEIINYTDDGSRKFSSIGIGWDVDEARKYAAEYFDIMCGVTNPN